MSQIRFDLGDGIELREVRARDVDELYAISLANRDHLAPWMPWARELQPQGTQLYVNGALAQQERNDGFQTVIAMHGTIIGTIGYHRVDWINRATSVGYWIAELHQGNGIVTAAVRTLVGHAFDAWNLHRVELAARPDNVRSRAIAERLGFRQEGVRREAERHGDVWHDLVLYALLATDPRL